jgi:hypothetical protein
MTVRDFVKLKNGFFSFFDSSFFVMLSLTLSLVEDFDIFPFFPPFFSTIPSKVFTIGALSEFGIS